MKAIVTLTLNPCIDGAAETEVVRPTHKIRTTNERYYPGGGGINVARVIAELGGPVLPVYLRGGATGALLDELMHRVGCPLLAVPIADHTRISHAVFERSTGLEYRFVAEGPTVSADEWTSARAAVEALDFNWLVVSGSLPRGLGPACCADLAAIAAARGARFVLDTSGAALAAALTDGHVFLAKPSLGELRALVGRPLDTIEAQDEAALALVRSGHANMLAVSLGHEGAFLACTEGVTRLRPPPVPVHSATGAGDSFLGAMVLALAEGRDPDEALRLALAAGTAAVLTPGTELCRRDDVLRLAAALAEAAED